MELLYTDNRIIVCLKPVGVLSTDEPGGMPELLRRALGEDETGCVRVLHRRAARRAPARPARGRRDGLRAVAHG